MIVGKLMTILKDVTPFNEQEVLQANNDFFNVDIKLINKKARRKCGGE